MWLENNICMLSYCLSLRNANLLYSLIANLAAVPCE